MLNNVELARMYARLSRWPLVSRQLISPLMSVFVFHLMWQLFCPLNLNSLSRDDVREVMSFEDFWKQGYILNRMGVSKFQCRIHRPIALGHVFFPGSWRWQAEHHLLNSSNRGMIGNVHNASSTEHQKLSWKTHFRFPSEILIFAANAVPWIFSDFWDFRTTTEN